MKIETRKKVREILTWYSEDEVSEDTREQIAAELLLEKAKYDVWDYLDDPDIVYQLARFVLSGRTEDRDTLLETMKECLVKNLNDQVDDACEEVFSQIKQECDAEHRIEYFHRFDNNECVVRRKW